jgi:pimeloyl-ACP methyl ester carboxylesterase
METQRQLVFIHGAGAGGWEWKHWRPSFAGGGWSALVPELEPCSGGIAATRLEDYVEQLIALMPNASRTPLVAVGASMGGLLALKLSERIRPAALVLVNSVPPAGTPGWPVRAIDFPAVIPWAANSALASTWASTLASTWERTRACVPDADEETVREAHAGWRDESGAVMRALYAGVPVRAPAVPTLVIIGQEDAEVPPEVGLALAKALAADVMSFAGVSHVGALLGARAGLIAGLARGWLDAVLSRDGLP